MSEFVRNPAHSASFEESSEPLNVNIRIKQDDYAHYYNLSNTDGPRFNQIQEFLTSKTHLCYFQRQKEFENKNKTTGRVSIISNYKIIVPFDSERAIEMIVGVYLQDGYSFKLNKTSHIRIVPFFGAPKKDFKQRTSNLIIRDLNDYNNFISEEKFKSFVSELNSLNLPVVDVNKEVDRRIWGDYVAALKKLIKQKEQVWKIKRVSQPYLSAKDDKTTRDTFIDVFIDERDLKKQFETELLTVFQKSEVEDYSVNDDQAFLEFKNYRIISEADVIKIAELGAEYFYDFSADMIYNYISGEVSFKYSDTTDKVNVFNHISELLKADYQLECDISSDGTVNIAEDEINCLEKVVADHYSKHLAIAKNSEVTLHVTLENRPNLSLIEKQVRERLVSENFESFKISNDAVNSVIIEASIHLPSAKFLDLGLQQQEVIYQFGSSLTTTLQPIDGVEIKNGKYQLLNGTNGKAIEALEKITTKFPKGNFKRRPTIYKFTANSRPTPKQMRDFKVAVDEKGKIEFNLVNSALTINANDEVEYKALISKIKSKSTNANIESKEFKPTYVLRFVMDDQQQRQMLMNRLQNAIREGINGKVELEVLSETRLLFRYYFKDGEERDLFIDSLKHISETFDQIFLLTFENPVGHTVIEMLKNESLELEKEKETARNVRQASFVFLSPEQKGRLDEDVKQRGEKTAFKEGIQIGTLFRKDSDKLTFKIRPEFDSLLTGNAMNRLEISEVAKGYIKPIFPGELTNLDRMIKAMEKVTNPGGRSEHFSDRYGNRLPVGFPVNRNLPNFLFDPTEARLADINFEDEKAKVLENLNEPLLGSQPKQLEAVVKAITAKDIALIQGPPGTGKTTVIAEIIWQILLRNRNARILITSQTNLAVDNALERLSGKKLVRPIRIGNIDKFEDEGKAYSNERIKQWLNTKDDLKQIDESKDNAVFDWIETVSRNSSVDPKYAEVIAKWKDGLEKKESIKKDFGSSYFSHVNVFAATCSECGSKNFAETYQYTYYSKAERIGDIEFDVVIMDEASKATPPELVLPLTFGKKVIIIGDHKQLPPMIDEEEFTEALESVGASKLIEHWDSETYKMSQFEKLFKNAPKSIVASLDTQFRMHEQIMNCISQFYKDQEELENGLLCGIKTQMDIPDFKVKASRWHGLTKEPFINPGRHAIWVDVQSPETKVGTSYENDGEIDAILNIMRVLKKSDGFADYFDHSAKEEDKEIGIITYYMPQMMKIRKTIYSHLQGQQWRNFELYKYQNEFELPFRVNTVDKFQGMERNVIIISTVRSSRQIRVGTDGKRTEHANTNYPRALGFAKELQRINVGLSRAKRLLIVVGNQQHFSHKNEYMEAMRSMYCVDIKQIDNLFKA